MLIRNIFILLIISFLPDLNYSQVILDKETKEKNEYRLYCSTDDHLLTVNKKDERPTLSYNGYYDPSNSGEFALPRFEIYIAIPAGTKPIVEFSPVETIIYEAYPELNPSVSVSNSVIMYKNSEELKIKSSAKVFSDRGYLWIGENYCLHLSLDLFAPGLDRVNVSLIKKFVIILKFNADITKSIETVSSPVNKIILNQKSAKSYHSKVIRDLPNTDSWIDYSSEYLKIGVNADGVYRIYYNDLIANGLNLSFIDPRTFKLFLRGEEIPIYLEGEIDGRFDKSDFIEFAGLRNMGSRYRETSTKGEAYKEFVNRYSDTTIYWLSWNGTTGKRASSQQLNTNAGSDTLKYYQEIIHAENNNWFDFSMPDAVQREMPYWSENKTWNEGNLGVGTRTKNFSLSDIYPDKTVKVFTKLQDYASSVDKNAHLLAISLNNSAKQDSGYINRFEQKVLQGSYNSNLLKTGNNALNLFSLPTIANPNLCIVDWYEIEYPRYLKAINDSLDFNFPFLTDSLPKIIKITNVAETKNYVIWKSGSVLKRYNSRVKNGTIEISDSVGRNDHFFLTDSMRTLTPKIYYKKIFANLRSQSNSADYVAITHKSFIKNVHDYADFISQNYKVKTRVIDVEDIYDEFSYGLFQPEAIRDFLITTHTKWQSPYPQYVILIGGATYDYLGNKSKFQGAPPILNYVPSFGSPVSDTWFTIWDTTGSYIPQINIGRLPVSKNEELLWYMEKHQKYVKQNNSGWNKRYLFFSGGTGNDENQIDILRNINNSIINNFVSPEPVGGVAAHFYKTINPTTNFGPYTMQQFQAALDSGGVFISYLGHSGTQTWDNSITDPGQLMNKINRSPLITDFGCSTAKFAEPDVVSFSQLFVGDPGGQAIAYIGNSSLGFTSTSYTFPTIFYKQILADSVYTIGDAHRLAKLELVKTYGSSSTYKLFCLSNTLIGDPIVKLPIPEKPNLSINADDIRYQTNSIIDSDDSLKILIRYFNYGKVPENTFSILIDSYYDKIKTFQKIVTRKIPMFIDSILVSVPIKNQPGSHSIQIVLDSNNKLAEISKTDNIAEIKYSVSSSSIKMARKYKYENKLANPITLFNPVSNPLSKNFQLELSADKNFTNFTSVQMDYDTITTKVNLPEKFKNKRVWLKGSINNSESYGDSFSFIYGFENSYEMSDSLSFTASELNNLKWDQGRVKLDNLIIHLRALSAGFNDGNTALIQINDQNLIPENTLSGHHIVLLEDSTYKFIQYKRFYILGDQSAVQDYINFLDTLSSKYLVLFAVSDEGSVSSIVLKNKIKLFGSKYIDNLSFRGSWAMIGKKGAKNGSVPESFSQAFNGRVQADTTIITRSSSGSLISSKIGPASEWKNLIINDSIPTGASMKYKIVGLKNDESADTLNGLALQNNIADLSRIDVRKYPYLKIKCDYSSTPKVGSPVMKSLDVIYKNPAELATNYQVVSIQKDSVDQGENIDLTFSVFNIGEAVAKNFKVNVEAVRNDKSLQKIFEVDVDSISANRKKTFSARLNTANTTGAVQLVINIDPENKISELYRDNNLFSIPIYIKPNQMPASLRVTFDGDDIINGDYVSANPDIKIELIDQSLLQIRDTSAVQIFLNNKPIYFVNNKDLAYSISVANPKFIADFKPSLENGSYQLRIIGRNASGQVIDSAGTIKKFSVMKDLQLLEVYNFPNPFNSETFFTFKLTQIPDELKIKIFTITGRMIKEINLSHAEMKYDFNKIYWDGRDSEGDLIANGVYLYKIISRKGNEISQSVQKLAIVR